MLVIKHLKLDFFLKPSPKLIAHNEQPAQRRIFEGLRSEIMKGKLTPGTQLPSTLALAATWQSNAFTVHTALSALAREGWVDRRPGSGTYIADPKNRFSCAGIYHDSDIASNEQRAFIRSVHFSLLKEFERLRKDTQVFIDSRPVNQQETLLPALAEAIRLRRIQCLVAPMLNSFNERSLTRLTIPCVFEVAQAPNHRSVSYDMKAMLRESVKRLAAQGCRSIGMISNLQSYYPVFKEAVLSHGLILHEQTRKMPDHFIAVPEFESYGYQQFKKLWDFPDKPDGLFVFPDMMVHGVILAILQTGMLAVTQRMKFIFHRNAHTRVSCPFPVTWATADEGVLAAEMIHLIQRQFRREQTTSVFVPLTFQEEVTLQ
jgi:DNA-binding transcriptional regulator YhcF (GntR family)